VNNPLELFHEWVDGPEVVLATATPGRAAVGAHGAAEERRPNTASRSSPATTRGKDASSRRIPARPCSSTDRGSRCASKAPSSECRPKSRTRTGRRGPRPRAGAPPPRTSRSRSARASSSRLRSTPSLPNRHGRSAGAATGSSRTPTSSGGIATTGCTNVTFSRHAVTAGTLSCCSHEARRRRNARCRAYGFDAVSTQGCRLSHLPGVEPLEPEGRHAPSRVELRAADRVDGRRRERARRLRQTGSTTARGSAFRTSSCMRSRRPSRASRSSTPTRATRGRIRSPRARRSKAHLSTQTKATVTYGSSIATRASSMSSPGCRRQTASGRAGPVRSGISARTRCALRAGRRPMPPACRSCLGSRAGTAMPRPA